MVRSRARLLSYCVFWCAAFFTIESMAQAASVKAVAKKRRKVKIDSGTKKGFKKGLEVCIFDKKDKEILCSKITRAKKSFSEIKVKSRKKLKKIKKGYRVELAGAASTAPYSYGIKGVWAPTIMTPVVYNKISYSAPIEESPSSLWNSAGTHSSSTQTFGLELELPDYGINVGMRFRTYQPFIAETDYDPDDASVFATTTITGSSTGFYLDYFIMEMFGLNLLAGLDFDMHSANLSTVKKSDDGEVEESEIANIAASGSALSLRTVMTYGMMFGPVGISAGVNFMIPLTLLGNSVVPTVTSDETNEDSVADHSADLGSAFAYGTGTIGLEILLGAVYGI